MSDTEWMARRACTEDDIDPEVFFVTGISIDAQNAIEYAKETCARCLVRTECEAYAVTNGIEYGIWGGKTEDERKAEALKRKLSEIARKYPHRPNAPTPDPRCGTYAGTKAHIKRREQFCRPCKDAKAEYERARVARKRMNLEEQTA